MDELLEVRVDGAEARRTSKRAAWQHNNKPLTVLAPNCDDLWRFCRWRLKERRINHRFNSSDAVRGSKRKLKLAGFAGLVASCAVSVDLTPVRGPSLSWQTAWCQCLPPLKIMDSSNNRFKPQWAIDLNCPNWARREDKGQKAFFTLTGPCLLTSWIQTVPPLTPTLASQFKLLEYTTQGSYNIESDVRKMKLMASPNSSNPGQKGWNKLQK